jgi:hypothetical protein
MNMLRINKFFRSRLMSYFDVLKKFKNDCQPRLLLELLEIRHLPLGITQKRFLKKIVLPRRNSNTA